MLKTAAVTGVPKTALKRADMPHMVISFPDSSFRCSARLKLEAMPAPMISAAPSLPAEPPQRWVRTVPAKMRGMMPRGMESPVRRDTITRFAPRSRSTPAKW